MNSKIKISLSIFIFLQILTLKTFAQSEEKEKFRRDYNQYVEYDANTKQWKDWQSCSATFAFNANANNDIIMYINGNRTVLRKISEIQEGKTNNGEEYQAMDVLNEDGEEIFLQLFDNGDCRFFFNNGEIIQFSH